MKKLGVLFFSLVLCCVAMAQRMTDVLDRGLVAIKVSNGVYVSWRVFGEEYYDVTYNLYRNGTKVNATPLSVSNYTDKVGTSGNTYTVAPVVNGVEQPQCAAVKVWTNQYFDIKMPSAFDRNGNVVSNGDGGYILNDVSLGDVTGDGVTEFIVKRNYVGADLNTTGNTTKFHHYECVDMSGKRLWWIDLGPNMMAGPDEQWDLVAYDWDGDGKAECVMRGADNMIIHTASGKNINIGNMSYVAPRDQYTCNGAEYLLYLNGETGEPYAWDGESENFTPMAFPLPRFEAGESDYGAVWGKAGDGGHRSSKFYFGAPVLDGRKASIFLGRGCYTRHKMCALDVDPVTHQLVQRWRWNQYSSGIWFGQGFHNFGIADVDWDGRDEIVFGSMVIDDNGKGLSTTGLGHGDAQHCRDFDPYRHGQEIFTCNETSPSMNYRNATTSKIYYRLQSTSDDGRALCGNFTNAYPGSVGRSTQSAMISSVADKPISELGDFIVWSDLNFRIFWDGDLLDEVLNSPGTEREAKIEKPGSGRIFTSSGCKMNNDSKNNPCATGDILGDWREEMVLRTGDNAYLRIYATTTPTSHRLYTLWHDHQYRNAMVWQCVGYNQPPHISYFTGELEGITVAPPPLTMTGRTEITHNGTIGTEHNGEHVIVCESGNIDVTVAEGASPSVATFNVPSWVQGSTNNSNIVYEKYTHTVGGMGFVGNTRLVKQGDGILNLPEVEMAHKGNTDIWAGTVNFDGTMKNSSLWLNRFAELNSNGGIFRSIKMDYASVLRPGGENSRGDVTTDTLDLNFGAVVEFDLYNDGLTSDRVQTKCIQIEVKDWKYGPQYSTPVFRLVLRDGTELADGDYIIAEAETVEGDLASIKIEGTGGKKCVLKHENGKVILVVEGVRDASLVVWSGSESSVWNYAAAMNFLNDGEASYFVQNDKVSFTDEAEQFYVQLAGELPSDTVFVNNSNASGKAYTFAGDGAITGKATLVKEGTGRLTITTDNTYTGGNRISGGTVSVSSLSNANQAYGNLGAVTTKASDFIIENGAVLQTTAAVQMGSPIQLVGESGGVINNNADFAMNKAFSGTLLTKRGGGWLKTYATGANLNRMVIAAGTVQNGSGNAARIVEFQGGSLVDNVGTSNEINVAEGKKGTWTTANRCNYSNKITGAGTLTVYCASESGSGWVATRTPLKLNMANFTGTLVPQATNASDGRFTLDTGSGLANGIMNIPSGITVQNTGKAFVIGELTGAGTLGAGCTFDQSSTPGINTWKVGSLNTDFTFGGSIKGSGTIFEKVGTGMMTLTGYSDFTGAATVSGGAVCLNKSNASSAMLGTGALTIADGAMLCGTGFLGNSSVTVDKGGMMRPGVKENSTSGTLEFNNKNVTISPDATVRFYARTRRYYTKLDGINRLTFKGTLKLDLADGIELEAGDSLILWTAKSVTLSSALVYELDSIGNGLVWDTSELKDGILRVKQDPTAIQPIAADREVACTVYTAGGVECAQFVCRYNDIDYAMQDSALPKGLYVVRVVSANTKMVEKRILR